MISADCKRIICEYEAGDAETMRRIQREAGAQFDRVWVGEVVESSWSPRAVWRIRLGGCLGSSRKDGA